MQTPLPNTYFEGITSKKNVLHSIGKKWIFIISFLLTWASYAGPGDIAGPTCLEGDQTGSYELEPEFQNYGVIDWWSDVDGLIQTDPQNPKRVSITPTNLNPTYVVLTAGVNYNQTPWYKTYSITIQIGCATKREGIQAPACVDNNNEYDLTVIAPYNGYTSIQWATSGNGTFDVDANDHAYATFNVGNNNTASVTVTTTITYPDATKNKTFTTSIDVGCVQTTPGITGPSCVEPKQPNEFIVKPSANNYIGIVWSTTGNANLTQNATDPTKALVEYERGNPSKVTLTADITYADASKNESLTLTVQLGGCTPITPIITGTDCAELLQSYTFTATPSNNNYATITWSATGGASITPNPIDPTKVTISYSTATASSTITAAVTYIDQTLNESIQKTIKAGNCNNTGTAGINGPSCVEPNQSYTYILIPEQNDYYWIDWWTDADAQIQKDPTDPKKVTVIFSNQNLAGSKFTLTAGVDYSSAPWWNKYSIQIQIGNCNNPSPSAIDSPILTTPHPFVEEAIISLAHHETILAAQIIDGNGIVVEKIEAVNDKKVSMGKHLKAGLYTVQITSDTGVYTDLIFKGE